MMRSVMFYPYLEPKDSEALRSSLLYWDTIQTITPSMAEQPYQTDTSKLLLGEGVLSPRLITQYEVRDMDIDDQAIDFLKNSDMASIINHITKSDTPYPKPHESFSNLHDGKLSYRLSEYLRRQRPSDSAWHSIPDSFAHFYMSLLANRISEKDGIDIMTDSYVYDIFSKKINLNSNIQAEHGARADREWNKEDNIAEGLLIQILMKKLVIRDDIPLTKIIEFRKNNTAQLNEFRGFIHDTLSTTYNSKHYETPKSAASTIEFLYTSKIKTEIDGLKKSLDESFITNTVKNYKVTGAISITNLIYSSIPQNIYTVLASLGVAIGIDYIIFKNNKKQFNNHKAYYPLSIQKEFGRFSF